MKKLTGILCMVAIAIPLLVPAWFLARQQVVRRNAKEKMKTALLQTIRVPKRGFSWVKKNKEIRVNGHLFDVKTLTDRGDHYEATGLYDQQEDLLHRQLNDWQQNQNRNKNKLLSAVFLQLLFKNESRTETVPPSKILVVKFNEFMSQRISPPYIEQIPRPPGC